MKMFTLEVPASPGHIGVLIQSILRDAPDLNERVYLFFGTRRLVARDKREREEHPTTVTAWEALMTLAASLFPE
jgi:hypothetical protein